MNASFDITCSSQWVLCRGVLKFQTEVFLELKTNQAQVEPSLETKDQKTVSADQAVR